MRLLPRKIVLMGVVAVGFAAVLAWSAAAQVSQGICLCSGNPPASLSVSSVSANQQLNICGSTLIVYNVTSQEAFYVLGSAASTTATTSGNSIPGNSFVVLSIPNADGAWYLAAITATGTTTLRFVQGQVQ